MRNKLLLPIMCCLLAIASGCSSAGYMNFAHEENEDQPGVAPKKIICINPIYSVSGGGKTSAADAVTRFEKKNQQLSELLVFNAQKARVELKIVDAYHLKANDQDYFNDLAPLLGQMLTAITTQGEIAESYGLSINEVEGIWNRAPLVDSRFSYLSKKYGTPYFMYAVLRHRKSNYLHTVWQALVVNVEAGTLAWAEYRTSRWHPHMDALDSMLYDFFNHFRRANS